MSVTFSCSLQVLVRPTPIHIPIEVPLILRERGSISGHHDQRAAQIRVGSLEVLDDPTPGYQACWLITVHPPDHEDGGARQTACQ